MYTSSDVVRQAVDGIRMLKHSCDGKEQGRSGPFQETLKSN